MQLKNSTRYATWWRAPLIFCLIVGVFVLFFTPVYAEDRGEVKEEILELHDSVQSKKDHLSDLEERISQYKKTIQKKQSEAISLRNQVALLENRIAKTELDIEAKGVEIERVRLEITILNYEIEEKEEQLARGREALAELLREVYHFDEQSALEIVLGNDTFSEFFLQFNLLLEVQEDLQGALDDVLAVKEEQETRLADRQAREASLGELKKTLEQKRFQIEDEQSAKTILLAYAQTSEAHFAELLRDLRAESQLIDNEVSALESQISERLRGLDIDFGGGAIFSSPLDRSLYITASFHDPTYPFRNLFEHSGTDFRAKQGTAVKAAAPGIVAVARTGRLYGNYVVILHGGNLATTYAHLSRINVSPDQFVARGDIIGRSGGMPGTRGAGFSTGPHLHFEVRLNGIPVDAMDYLLGI